MKLIRAIPTLGALLVVYLLFLAVVNFNNPQFKVGEFMNRVIHSQLLPSKVTWAITVGDVIILLGLLSLFVEILKSTSASDTSIFEHILSTFVFMFYVIAFLMVPIAANSTFLILGCMSLIDVIAGFTISISAARRDFSVG